MRVSLEEHLSGYILVMPEEGLLGLSKWLVWHFCHFGTFQSSRNLYAYRKCDTQFNSSIFVKSFFNSIEMLLSGVEIKSFIHFDCCFV